MLKALNLPLPAGICCLGVSFLCHQIFCALLRKLSITLFILILLGAAIWAVDRWSILPIFSVNPMDIVPAEASVIVTLSEMDKILEFTGQDTSDAWQHALLTLPGFREDLVNVNRLIDTLFPSRMLIDRTDGAFCLVPVGDGKMAGTWIIDLRNMGNFDPVEWLKAKRLNYQSSSFRGQEVCTVRWGDNRQLALGRVRNLLVIGKLPYQVEAALAAQETPVNWMDALRTEASAEALCSIYLHPERWKDIIDQLFTEAGRPVGYDWAEWLEGARIDLFRQGEGYRLGGQVRSNGQWMDNRVPPAAMQADLWGMLPANTAAIKAVNLEDPLGYFREHRSGGVRRFQRFFLPWMHGPLLELTLRPFNAQLEARQLYFFGFRDESRVREAMNEWMEEVGILESIDYQGFLLTQVYESESLYPFSGENWDNPWWTIVDGYVILATNRSTLENWIDQYVVGNGLPLTEVARQVTLSESSGQFTFFLDWKQWRTGWQYLFEDDALADAIAHLGQLAFRVKTEGKQGDLHGLWMPLPELEEEEDLSWRTVLTNQITGGPWPAKGREGNPLIFAQDAANRLYLLDGAGKIKWQQPLDSRILSPIETLRWGGNAAYTFNTATAIYLMDQSGNPIAPFPLRLSNPTRLPQTVVDFSADHNYSFFTVSTDGCVYGYEMDGGPVAGWNPQCELGQVQQPLLHFQVDNKDYLVLRNSGGTVRAFARDGTIRLQADFPAGPGHAALQWQALAGKEQIVSCTDSGLVEVIPLEGEPIQFQLPVGPNLDVDLIYHDFLGDSRNDYLLSSGRTVALHAYTNRGLVRQFEQNMPQPVDEVFSVPSPDGGKAKIGVLLANNAKIYMLSGNGATLPGFPLAGSTTFFLADLFKTGETHLIVGYQDEILAYRLPDLQ